VSLDSAVAYRSAQERTCVPRFEGQRLPSTASRRADLPKSATPVIGSQAHIGRAASEVPQLSGDLL
jgi:hypothetical protein